MLAEWECCAAAQYRPMIPNRNSLLQAAADVLAAAVAAYETAQRVDMTQYTLAALVQHERQQLEDTRKTCGPVVCKYCK